MPVRFVASGTSTDTWDKQGQALAAYQERGAGERLVQVRPSPECLLAGWVMAMMDGWVLAIMAGWVMAIMDEWVMANMAGWVMVIIAGWVLVMA